MEAGGRRQEAGGRRQEAGDRRQETGDRRQEENTYKFLTRPSLFLYRYQLKQTIAFLIPPPPHSPSIG
ncbi:hypothetical protein V0288_10530 [Pannus brasiliensis CCIBt3594]|uniref:Uncharacterized protein n=1 Tax=Pannus brasiliensis CCIBt3594 TaxID=1427578 RepID=A0AAW9QKT0_9CHRO